MCNDFSIDPFDFDPSNRKLELQLTSCGDRFREQELHHASLRDPLSHAAPDHSTGCGTSPKAPAKSRWMV